MGPKARRVPNKAAVLCQKRSCDEATSASKQAWVIAANNHVLAQCGAQSIVAVDNSEMRKAAGGVQAHMKWAARAE